MYSVYILPNVLSIYRIKCKHLKKSCLSKKEASKASSAMQILLENEYHALGHLGDVANVPRDSVNLKL